jgi:hypothetical protein
VAATRPVFLGAALVAMARRRPSAWFMRTVDALEGGAAFAAFGTAWFMRTVDDSLGDAAAAPARRLFAGFARLRTAGR